MEVGMSLNALVKLPLSTSRRTHEDLLSKHSLFTSSTKTHTQQRNENGFVIQAKQKRGMQARQFTGKTPPPQLPKIEDDGNPKFVIFIRMANVYLWYPINIITGGTTAKIMVAAKDNFLGKYIYKDTIARNLAAVLYQEGKNLRAGLSSSGVIELPTKDELKTVLDKVLESFGDAKESFGKLTSLGSTSEGEPAEEPKPKSK
ncbi:hypothetical protein C5167_050047 [Papaver somniferum]|uniref:Protein HHL1, chloroplastic n=1 Tax=Papaver somniferum TaxID=3469 RepID=A0A4Y7KMJ0_PAPSO|nr:hypothetical protein C5167_050047 [Papaver somniferum]